MPYEATILVNDVTFQVTKDTINEALDEVSKLVNGVIPKRHITKIAIEKVD